MQVQTLGFAISGSFALLAVVLSAWQIWTHLIYNPNPKIRKFIIRILLMVPIYSLESWLALVVTNQELLFETLRDCYEAFVLYSFYCFLVEYLGGQQVLAHTLRSKRQVRHVVPCCCVGQWRMGGVFLRYSTMGILQYIPIKVIVSIITLISSMFQVYGEGKFTDPTVAYPYICLTLNLSQGWAVYCLILFFLGTKEELAPVKPIPKFLAIKAIIFFTYWQSVLISILVFCGVITDKWEIGCPDCWSANKISAALINFIICVEMLMFAIAHHYVFSIEDFLHPSSASGGKPVRNVNAPLLSNLMDAINVSDVATDVRNSRQEILTKKQALAAQFDAYDHSPRGTF